MGPCTFIESEINDNLPHCLDYTKPGVKFEETMENLEWNQLIITNYCYLIIYF